MSLDWLRWSAAIATHLDTRWNVVKAWIAAQWVDALQWNVETSGYAILRWKSKMLDHIKSVLSKWDKYFDFAIVDKGITFFPIKDKVEVMTQWYFDAMKELAKYLNDNIWDSKYKGKIGVKVVKVWDLFKLRVSLPE